MTQDISKRRTVDFQGSINIISIEGIFQLLYYADLTGKLILLNPPTKASFYFNKGTLTWGTMYSQQKQIGQRLIESSYITTEQLKKSLTVHISEKQQTRLGKILVEMGFLQPEILSHSLKLQVKDVFFEVLNWSTGTFAFISGIHSPDKEIILNERIDHLLLEGVVHLDKYSGNPLHPQSAR